SWRSYAGSLVFLFLFHQACRTRLSNQHQFALKGREKLAATLGDQHVFLQAEVARLGGHAEFEREDVAPFDDAFGGLGVFFPFRPEECAAVVAGAADAVAEGVLEFIITGFQDNLPHRSAHIGFHSHGCPGNWSARACATFPRRNGSSRPTISPTPSPVGLE